VDVGGKSKSGKRTDQPGSIELFNLKTDFSESTDVASQHPEIVAHLDKLVAEMKDDLGISGAAPGSRPLGKVVNSQPLIGYDGKVRPGIEPKAGLGVPARRQPNVFRYRKQPEAGPTILRHIRALRGPRSPPSIFYTVIFASMFPESYKSFPAQPDVCEDALPYRGSHDYALGELPILSSCNSNARILASIFF
jgi:hypothetical protein